MKCCMLVPNDNMLTTLWVRLGGIHKSEGLYHRHRKQIYMIYGTRRRHQAFCGSREATMASHGRLLGALAPSHVTSKPRFLAPQTKSLI
jgi:hypothetical protein